MEQMFERDLALNASLLLLISIVFITFYIRYWKKKRLYSIILGFIVGVFGILLLLNTVELRPGVVFDVRSILICLSGMFFGLVPTVIGAVMICAYRIYMGGAGAVMGVLVTVFSAAIGLVWKKIRWAQMQKRKLNWLEFYLFGLVTHIVMMACVVTLPRDMIQNVYQAIVLPVLAIYPLITMVLCMVLFDGLYSIQVKESFEEKDIHLRTVFEQAPLGIAIVVDGETVLVNDRLKKIVGRPKEQLEKMGWVNFTHPDDIEKDKTQFARLMAGDISDFSMDKRFIKPDGSILWAHLIVAALQQKGPCNNSHILIIQEITDIIRAREELKSSEAKYRSLSHDYEGKQALVVGLLNAIPDLIFYKDLTGKYAGCNQAYERFVNKKETEIIGKTDYDLFDKERAEWFRQCDLDVLESGIPQRFEDQVITNGGRIGYFDTVKSPYYDAAGNQIGIIGISRDVSQQKAKEFEIKYLNYHDVLTGLFNRAYFEGEKGRLDQESFLPLSVVFGDINGLKLINDAIGHDKGDEILKATAGAFAACARENDIAARISGDEFCLLMPNTKEPEARAVMEQIMNACSKKLSDASMGMSYNCISLGHATKTSLDEDLAKVLKTAEESMYLRKLLVRESLHSTFLTSIKTAMHEKSLETRTHCDRSADLSRLLGNRLGLNDEDIVTLILLSELHDIGKINIDNEILMKTDKLTPDEWQEIKKHPETGYRIARTVPELNRVAEYILAHHERWDGNGYPRGLKGKDIPYLSRIIAVVDTFDAMTNDRIYRRAKSFEEALKEIEKEAGKQFDPEIAGAFVEIMRDNKNIA